MLNSNPNRDTELNFGEIHSLIKWLVIFRSRYLKVQIKLLYLFKDLLKPALFSFTCYDVGYVLIFVLLLDFFPFSKTPWSNETKTNSINNDISIQQRSYRQRTVVFIYSLDIATYTYLEEGVPPSLKQLAVKWTSFWNLFKKSKKFLKSTAFLTFYSKKLN